MRVLILGGSGFIGSHVIDGLLEQPNVEIWSMDRSPEQYRSALSGVKYFRNDFGNRGVQEDILSQGIDTVIHLISSTIPASSNKDPVFDIQSNLIETIAFLDLAVKYKVKRVIFVSSGGTIYGEQPTQPIAEGASLWPLCSYGIVKSAIEKYLHMYHKLYGLETLTIRLANPYGPRQDPTRGLGAISVFLYRYLKGLPIEIWGDGSIVRDYIYIEDVRKVIVQSVVMESVTGCYNVGSGKACSLNDILLVMRESGFDPQVNYVSSRSCDIKSVVLDCSHIYMDLGWKAEVTLVEGMKKSYAWMKKMVGG